ncbi:MAG: hypothetical protein H0X16_03185 [Chloroflexi bacterium]|nr:hypothetical protein [Chloroflexota bacterium]
MPALRAKAESALTELREARRTYEESGLRSEVAARGMDQQALSEAKEAARRAFRLASAKARSRDEVGHAAGTWLREIDRLNRAALAARDTLQRERETAPNLHERLQAAERAADAARISADSAADACAQARILLAACEEEFEPQPMHGPAGSLLDTREAALFRLLRRDRHALENVVEHLAAGDTEERRRVQLLLSDLVDGIFSAAIDDGSLNFPDDHPFWGAFAADEQRAVSKALAGLGFHFDGLGGFAASRIPGPRDLSLAVGYAGLDPLRIRRWPSQAEMAALYQRVRVRADEFVVGRAPSLGLEEVMEMLGGRAKPLDELWDNWGRVRPALLGPAVAPG